MAGIVKLKTEVNYKTPIKTDKRCRNCDYYDYSRCQVVAGRIQDDGVCDMFAPKEPPKTGPECLCSPSCDD